MSAAYPKVSFLVPRPALDKVQAFAALHGMKMSEALRFVIDVGLENLASVEQHAAIAESVAEAGYISCNASFEKGYRQAAKDAADKIREIKRETKLEPTRGKFPRPTGGSP